MRLINIAGMLLYFSICSLPFSSFASDAKVMLEHDLLDANRVIPPAPIDQSKVYRLDEIERTRRGNSFKDKVDIPYSEDTLGKRSYKVLKGNSSRRKKKLQSKQSCSNTLKPTSIRRSKEVLIKLIQAPNNDARTKFLKTKAKYQQRKKNPLEKIGYLRVTVPQGISIEAYIDSLYRDKIAESIEPNIIVKSLETFNLPDQNTWQWGLTMIQAPETWSDKSFNKRQVSIAVIDSGVDVDHPDLKDILVEGYNFIDENTNVEDDFGHGTLITGIIAARKNEEKGIAGLVSSCKVIPLKVLDSYGEGSIADLAEAIIYAADNGCEVINLALGTYEWSNVLDEAVKYAALKNCVLVAASGNNGIEKPCYPAAFPSTIAVAAIDEFGQKCNFSNFGQHIDVSAPGKNIYSTTVNGKYEYITGTSAATAFVSGYAALICSGIKQDNESVFSKIIASCEDVEDKGWDPKTGHGFINNNLLAICKKPIEKISIIIVSNLPLSPLPWQTTSIKLGIRNNYSKKDGIYNAFLSVNNDLVSLVPSFDINPKEYKEVIITWDNPNPAQIFSNKIEVGINYFIENNVVRKFNNFTIVSATKEISDIAIVNVRIGKSLISPSESIGFSVEIANFGNKVSENVYLSFSGDDQENLHYYQLKPGESKIFTMAFYLDPSLDSDGNLDNLKELVFTYEFSEYKS